ncbi:MAG: hypothetical protein ACJ74H_12250 [Thermoanaerobaculia bacterium]
MRALTCIVAFALALPWNAGVPRTARGVICVAPFHAGPKSHGPNMSQTTWAPAADSKFEFRIGKNIKATVPAGRMVTIANVPADRRVMIGIRLDGKPFESFPIDLRKEEKNRACLWLYEGYWHWVNMGWSEGKGCRCGG